MNSENFHEYVKNPSMLHQVSYQELKSLVLQYPYSPNLRYLLLLKSLFDNHKDFDRNQVLASLSSPDRKKLRQLVKQYSRLRELQENYSLNEDFLELKDLSALEDLMAEPTGADATQEQGRAEAAAVPPSPSSMLEDILDEEIEEESDLNFLSRAYAENSILESLLDETAPPPVPEPSAATTNDDELPSLETLMEEAVEPIDNQLVEAPPSANGTAGTPVNVVPEAEEPPTPAKEVPLEITNEPAPQPAPRPRSSFNSWLKQLNPPQAGLMRTELRDISLNSKQPQPQTDAIKADSAKHIAEQSVEEDNDIASETLALLLEKQKLYGKAISMYERLQLKYPEKSSLFAAKIEELNKKMDA